MAARGARASIRPRPPQLWNIRTMENYLFFAKIGPALSSSSTSTFRDRDAAMLSLRFDPSRGLPAPANIQAEMRD